VSKNIESKLNLQTVELAQRSKIIEELKKSLSLLINKYNELKKEYDRKIVKKNSFGGIKIITGFNFNILPPEKKLNKSSSTVALPSMLKGDETVQLKVRVKDLTRLLDEKDVALKSAEERLRDITAEKERQVGEERCSRELEVERVKVLYEKNFNDLETENFCLKNMYEEVRVSLCNENKGLENKIKEYEIEIHKLSAERKELILKFEILKTDDGQSTTIISEKELIIQKLKQQNLQMEADKLQDLKILNTLKEQFILQTDVFYKNLNALKTKTSEKCKKQTQKISKLKDIILQIQQKLSLSREKEIESGKTITLLYDKVKSINLEKNKFQQQFVDISKKFTESEEKQKKHVALIQISESTINQLNLKIEKLTTTIQTIQVDSTDDINGIKGENNALKRRVQELTTQLNQYVIENQGKSKVIEERNDEIRILKQKL
jgi:hypothetical protein